MKHCRLDTRHPRRAEWIDRLVTCETPDDYASTRTSLYRVTKFGPAAVTLVNLRNHRPDVWNTKAFIRTFRRAQDHEIVTWLADRVTGS